MKEYVFSDVFGEKVSNNEIFRDSIIDGINGVTEGYNCTIFAYGITGSGKTFSIFGHPKL
jgi:kinesin family protein 18/19